MFLECLNPVFLTSSSCSYQETILWQPGINEKKFFSYMFWKFIARNIYGTINYFDSWIGKIFMLMFVDTSLRWKIVHISCISCPDIVRVVQTFGTNSKHSAILSNSLNHWDVIFVLLLTTNIWQRMERFQIQL